MDQHSSCTTTQAGAVAAKASVGFLAYSLNAHYRVRDNPAYLEG